MVKSGTFALDKQVRKDRVMTTSKPNVDWTDGLITATDKSAVPRARRVEESLGNVSPDPNTDTKKALGFVPATSTGLKATRRAFKKARAVGRTSLAEKHPKG
jgi:hypothetical protein